jgi:hypothetical protein
LIVGDVGGAIEAGHPMGKLAGQGFGERSFLRRIAADAGINFHLTDPVGRIFLAIPDDPEDRAAPLAAADALGTPCRW